MILPISQENALARLGVQPAPRGLIRSRIRGWGVGSACRRKPILWKIVPGDLADSANSSDISRGAEVVLMGDWLERRQFRPVDLLWIIAAALLFEHGHWRWAIALGFLAWILA